MDQPDAMLASLLHKSRAWAARLYHFNYRPADYLHPSRRREFTGVLANDSVWNEMRARSALSTHILATLGADGEPCFDLAHEEWPLLLLDASQLDRLVRHVAATLHSQVIARCIEQQELSQWKLFLGIDGYKFALHGTSLLPDFDLPKMSVHAADALIHAYGWIEAALSAAPGPLLERGRLKLPAGLTLPGPTTELAQHLVFALLFILEPKWRSSFAEIRK